MEDARPASAGEEEMQLQIALALSREESEKEEELRKKDDIGLQVCQMVVFRFQEILSIHFIGFSVL